MKTLMTHSSKTVNEIALLACCLSSELEQSWFEFT